MRQRGLAENERANARRSHRECPGPGASLEDLPLQTNLMLEEHVELVAGTKILLGADPHRSDAELPVGPQLGRPSPDPAIAGHNHEIEPGKDWHPIQVRSADRNFWQVFVTGIEHIDPATPS